MRSGKLLRQCKRIRKRHPGSGSLCKGREGLLNDWRRHRVPKLDLSNPLGQDKANRAALHLLIQPHGLEETRDLTTFELDSGW